MKQENAATSNIAVRATIGRNTPPKTSIKVITQIVEVEGNSRNFFKGGPPKRFCTVRGVREEQKIGPAFLAAEVTR